MTCFEVALRNVLVWRSSDQCKRRISNERMQRMTNTMAQEGPGAEESGPQGNDKQEGNERGEWGTKWVRFICTRILARGRMRQLAVGEPIPRGQRGGGTGKGRVAHKARRRRCP